MCRTPMISPSAVHRGHFKIGVGPRFLLSDQRMVPRCVERVTHSGKQPFAVVVNRRNLAVHDPVVANHIAAEGVADALVPQTHAENGNGSAEAFQHVVGNARFTRRARPRRNDDVRGRQGRDFVEA